MSLLPIELWQTILDYSRHWEQLYLTQLCKQFHTKLALDFSNRESLNNYLLTKYKTTYGSKTLIFEINKTKFLRDLSGRLDGYKIKALAKIKQKCIQHNYTLIVLNNIERTENIDNPKQ